MRSADCPRIVQRMVSGHNPPMAYAHTRVTRHRSDAYYSCTLAAAEWADTAHAYG